MNSRVSAISAIPSTLAIALAVTAPLTGCIDEGDALEQVIDERTLEPLVGTQCGVQEWFNEDGTRAENPIVYYFDNINNQLERDAELRAQVGLEAVTTCAEAERFAAAQQAYDEANPFDERDELPVSDVELEEESFPRIYNGQSTNKAGVVMIGPSTNKLKCSGVFITPRHILTSAHCFTSGGAQSIGIKEDDLHEANRDSFVHIHPNYTGPGSSDVNDDIAIISLWNDLPWTPTPHRFYTGSTFTGTQLQIYGYGYINNNEQGAGTLRRGAGGTPVNLNYHTGGYFRATAHTARNCKGDSGGPAIHEVINVPITWGLATHHETYPWNAGDACPSEGNYMRWTKTNVKASWIASKLLENHDGDFSCSEYTYGGGSYYRCW